MPENANEAQNLFDSCEQDREVTVGSQLQEWSTRNVLKIPAPYACFLSPYTVETVVQKHHTTP